MGFARPQSNPLLANPPLATPRLVHRLVILGVALASQILAVTSVRGDSSDLDETLCGPRPPAKMSDAQEKAEQERIYGIQRKLPPVANQHPSSWCYAYSTADLLNFYLGSGSTPARQVSPLDLVAKERAYLERHAQGEVINPGFVHMDVGGNAMKLLIATQDDPQVRNIVQVPVDSLDSEPQKARAKVRRLVEEFEKLGGSKTHDVLLYDEPCNRAMVETHPLSQNLNGILMVSGKIFDEATKIGAVVADGHAITRYPEVVKDLGPPAITVPPMVVHQFNSEDPKAVLGKISSVLASKRPLSVGLCAVEIEPKAATGGDSCGAHAVTIVGSGYSDGKCYLRIRNSWGQRWQDGGYMNLTPETFVRSLKTSQTALSWITPDTEPGSLQGRRLSMSTPKYTFTGLTRPKIEGPLDLARDTDVAFEFRTGRYADLADQSARTYQDGVVVHGENIPLRSKDGSISGRFTGEMEPGNEKGVSRLKKGKITRPDGKVEDYPRQ